MQIQTLCHAAFVVGDKSTKIIIDPWLSGRIIMGAWALNPDPLPETIENLPKIDYIYCTHEHPDHFHPPSLKKLLDGPAKGATICIPRFMVDRFAPRIKQFASDTPIVEMWHGKKYKFGTITAWSYQYRNDDTTIVLQGEDGYTIINSNDTFVKGWPLQQIKKRHPNPNVLLNQFSVSNAYPYGYEDYKDSPDEFPWQEKDLKEYCVNLINTLNPQVWIPYQSFVSFCRVENEYLNGGKTSIDSVAEYVTPRVKNTRVQKMFPGDVLDRGTYKPHPEGENYFRSFKPLLCQEVRPSTHDELLKAIAVFEESFKKSVSKLIRKRIRPCGFIVQEDQTHLLLDPLKSKVTIGGEDLRKANPDLGWTKCSRQVITSAMRVPWGFADLLLSGCIITRVPKQYRNKDFIFWAVALIRASGYLNLGSLWFLKPRALLTIFRRRAEALQIVWDSMKFGGFEKGNLMPRKTGEKHVT